MACLGAHVYRGSHALITVASPYRFIGGIEAIQWAKKVEKLGAGEILLTSIDKDGTENGYDLELIRAISRAVRIPVIASGGCGSQEHILEVFRETDVEAALAASIFHYEKATVNSVKRYLVENGVNVRI